MTRKRHTKAPTPLSSTPNRKRAPGPGRTGGACQRRSVGLGAASTAGPAPGLTAPEHGYGSNARSGEKSLISPSPSAHLQLPRPDFSQNYLQLSGT